MLKIIKNFSNYKIDLQKLSYYQMYLKNYYNEKFNHEQGTETILEVLKKYSSEGVWLDVGAGPVTFFWALMLNQISQIHCSEINVEGLIVLEEFVNANVIPSCYLDVIQLFKLPRDKVSKAVSLPRKLMIFDALKKWPSKLNSQYDMITALGVFGLCENSQQYKNCFKFAKKALKKRGVIIGANWKRSDFFIKKGNRSNSYLNTSLIEVASQENGYQILHLSNEIIKGDPNYDNVIVWALKA